MVEKNAERWQKVVDQDYMQTSTPKEKAEDLWEKKELGALQPQLTLEELHKQQGQDNG